MCTVIILRRPEHPDWPLILATNRDEMMDRPADPPARHWPDRPDVIAGRDRLAGGSWLGMNDHGVVAAILNRRGTLGPEKGKRSRGEIVLEALDHAEARTASEALAELDPRAYRPFNLVIADSRQAFWLRHAGDVQMELAPLDKGLSMLAAGEVNDPACARTKMFRPLFLTTEPPGPERGDWSDWQLLLTAPSTSGEPRDGMCFCAGNGYGTVSSSLIALPSRPSALPQWLHAPAAPDQTAYLPVETRPIGAEAGYLG